MWFGARMAPPVGGHVLEALDLDAPQEREQRVEHGAGRRRRAVRPRCPMRCERYPRDCTSSRTTPSSALAVDRTASPRVGGRVDGGDRPRRVEVVVERGPDLVERADVPADRTGRPAPPATVRADPPPAASARRPTPTGRGSGARRWPGGSPVASHVFSRSLTNTRLPSDFDIFSPSMRTMAWCIQWRTKVSPVAASDCAASHSWCGKIRSAPPPCRSIVVSSSRRASAEHSMCQPGRPGPHSDSHDGSSGATAARARSRADRACSGRRRCRRARAASSSISSRS